MKLQLTTEKIVSLLPDAHLAGNPDSCQVEQIITDSRSYFGEPNVLFVAIKGHLHDGHQYIKELFIKGIRCFLVEEEIDAFHYPDAQFIQVEKSITALQLLASNHRQQFTYPVIAITGSNGKTIVKEWLYHLLKNRYNIIRSPKSYNSQLGVALSVLQMTHQHQLAIIEAGISQPGEMDMLNAIIRPDYGILTAIGRAHSENFDSTAHTRSEKLKLFNGSKWYYDFSANERYIQSIDKRYHKTYIRLQVNDTTIEFSIPFEDDASIQNAITCALFLLQFGISPTFIEKEMERLPQIALRLETRKGKKHNIIIDDSYSNDIPSLKIALDFLSKQDKSKNHILILSDFIQEKEKDETLYTSIAQIVNDRQLSQFIGVGPHLNKYGQNFRNAMFFENTAECLTYLQNIPFENSLILLKGARAFQFEKIGKLLEEKTHETRLTIDLSAIRHNIQVYRSLLPKTTRLLCMIKAFGYGSGSKELGRVLSQNNIDYFGVAYADEGVELRKDGIQTPIIVMNAEDGAFDEMIANGLEPSIYSFRQLDKFIRVLIDQQIKSYPIHIKIDTGMRRLGFLSHEMEELISTISSQPEVRVKSVFSHLAAADDPGEDLFTTKQLQQFDYCAQKLETGLGYSFIRHISNTSGIERFPQARYDMVRLGLGLYGLSETLETLETVSSLTTVISQIKQVKKGESIGYSRAEYALEDTTIGIIPIGYADGYLRRLSKGEGHVWVNGQLAPTIGNVCMDMTMINLNGITAKEGDEVEIFGKHRPIGDLAGELDTINYEVLTSISQRVVRVYVE
jgi:Alr-MurF fusion protein